eukprot:jgi/Chrzof1/11109/Cz05g24040.t1
MLSAADVRQDAAPELNSSMTNTTSQSSKKTTDSNSSSIVSGSDLDNSAPSAGPGLPGSASGSRSQMSAAAKDLVRDILAQDQHKRTQELIDAAWQSLE